MRFVRSLCLAGAATLPLLLQVAPARAQQPTDAQISAIRSACRSDFMANCSGVQPGGRDALQCLQRNVANLSPSCKSAVAATMPAPAKPAAAAPPPPVAAAPAKPVAAAPPPAAAAPVPAPAAEENHPAPAPAPAAQPPAHAAPAASLPQSGAATRRPSPAQANAIRESCRSDFMAHCPGVTPGGAQALTCLQKNVGRLSRACRTAVAATMGAPPAAPHAAKPSPAAAATNRPAPPEQPEQTVPPLHVRPFIMPQRRVVIVAICGADVRTLCSGVPPGGERILECLAAQAGRLSPPCYNAIARVSRE